MLALLCSSSIYSCNPILPFCCLCRQSLLYPGAQGCMNLSLTRLFLWGHGVPEASGPGPVYLAQLLVQAVGVLKTSLHSEIRPCLSNTRWNIHLGIYRSSRGMGWGATGTVDDGRVSVAVVAEVDVAADIGPRVGDLASTVPAVVSSFVTCSPSASRIPSPFLAGKMFFFDTTRVL